MYYSISRRSKITSTTTAVLLRRKAVMLTVAVAGSAAWIVRVDCLLGQEMRHGATRYDATVQQGLCWLRRREAQLPLATLATTTASIPARTDLRLSMQA